jgi:hypothetical protein
VARPVDARRIQKDRLPLFVGADAQDAVPGSLGLVRDNGNLLPDDLVEKSGFAYVRSSDDAYES